MDSMLILLGILLLGLNCKATHVLVTSPRYDFKQKFFQLALVWLLPVVGALLVWSLAKDAQAYPTTTDLTDREGLDGYKIPDGVGEGIGHD